jgi:predicted DNA-binding transcriptional regulator YafY
MRRADRLFQVLQILRRRRLTTARRLAEELEVSERTIYRDVADLMASGVPVEGEPGMGYTLRGFDLPPLMFTEVEIEALVLGARVVESWTDAELARAALDVLRKVEAVLPPSRRSRVRDTRLFAPTRGERPPSADLRPLRAALREQRKIHIEYEDAQGVQTARTVRPLALAFFGPIWVLSAWCELRDDFRSFRPDRMRRLDVLADSFHAEPGKTLEDYMRRVGIDGDPA